MRISTATIFQQFNNSLDKQQISIAKLQNQISSGKKILTPSDDPAGAARALDVKQGIHQLDQFQSNIVLAEQHLNLEEETLNGITNLIQRVKELALLSNSGSQTDETLFAYRSEVDERLNELLNIANTKDSNGDYLFSGFSGNTQPFSQSGNTINYNGDQGQRFIQVANNRNVAVSDSGYEIFQRNRNGNGTFSVSANAANTGSGVLAAGFVVNPTAYQAHDFTIRFTSATTFDVINTTTATTILAAQPYTEGNAITFNGIETSISGSPATGDEFFVQPSANQDLFGILQNFSTALSSNPTDNAGRAQVTQSINGVIADLDGALGHILEIRTSVGARLNSIESTSSENEAVKFQLQSTLSDVEDLDYAEAIGLLEFKSFTLEAAQQSFIRVQNLSMFDFLR